MSETNSRNRSRRRNVRHPVIPYFIDGSDPKFVLIKNEIGIKIIKGKPRIVIGNGLDPVDILEEYSMITEITTGKENGTISVNGEDVAVKGLKTAAYLDADEIFKGLEVGTIETVDHDQSASVELTKSEDGKTLLNMSIPRGEAGPVGPTPLYKGTTSPSDTNFLWVNTTTGLINYHDGSKWKPISYAWA